MNVRNPRYTGENRCWPCTVVNLSLIGLVTSAVALVISEVFAAIVLLTGIVSIGVRGYVVPGTPQMTQHLPAPLLSVFNKEPSSPSEDMMDNASRDGALIESSENGIQLSQRVQKEYQDRARDLASDRDRLKTEITEAFDGVEQVTVNRSLGGDENWFAKDLHGDLVLRWDTRPVAAMDVAGEVLLSEHVPNWAKIGSLQRRRQRALLRRAAETCPICESKLRSDAGSKVVCCGGRSLAGTLRCPECSYRVFDNNDLPNTVQDGIRIIQ